MKNIIKKITASALALTLLGTGTIVKDYSGIEFLKNDQMLTADAATETYIKYTDINDYINKVLRGQRKIKYMTYYVPTYHFLDWRTGRAYRDNPYDSKPDLGIPNEMNCTVISVENLLIGYLSRYRGFKVNDAAYKSIYDDLIKVAKNNYGYTSGGGLDVWDNKPFCQEIMRRYGISNANVDTFSRYQWSITLPNMPQKSFILSSTVTNHSILVYSTVTWHLEYRTKEGYQMYEDVDFLECYDPNGDHYLLEAGNIVDTWGIDLEQVMYVTNY